MTSDPPDAATLWQPIETAPQEMLQTLIIRRIYAAICAMFAGDGIPTTRCLQCGKQHHQWETCPIDRVSHD